MQIVSLKWSDGGKRFLVINDSGASIPWSDKNPLIDTWIAELIADAISSGMTIADPDPPPPPTKDETDTIAAKQYQKAQALFAMSPAQVVAWVDANINTMADAKDAIKTLAVIVSVLGRRL